MGSERVGDTTKRLHLMTVKHLTTMQETQVQSLDWEDILEKEIATLSSILAWKIPWTEEPGAIVHGVTKSQTQLSALT